MKTGKKEKGVAGLRPSLACPVRGMEHQASRSYDALFAYMTGIIETLQTLKEQTKRILRESTAAHRTADTLNLVVVDAALEAILMGKYRSDLNKAAETVQDFAELTMEKMAAFSTVLEEATQELVAAAGHVRDLEKAMASILSIRKKIEQAQRDDTAVPISAMIRTEAPENNKTKEKTAA